MQRAPLGGFGDVLRLSAPAVSTVAVVCVLAFLSGGYIFSRSAPLAIAYALFAAVLVWLARRPTKFSVVLLAALVSYGCFLMWAGISVLWSIGPDLSWVAFDVAALYLAVVALLGLTPVRRVQLRLVGVGYLAVAVAVGGYAFLGKALPDVVTHAHAYARLSSPVGYWNVLALMLVMALPVALALAGDRSAGKIERLAAAAAAVPILAGFFFTFSRGGWVGLAVALVIYFAFAPARLAVLASLAAMAAPISFVFWRLRGLSTLFTETQDAALRTSEGHTLLVWSLVALAGTVVAQVLVIWGQKAWRPAPRVRVAIGAAILLVLVTAGVFGTWRFVESRGGTAWARDRAGAFFGDSDTTSSVNNAGRLLSLNTGRIPLWREALEQSRYRRLSGTGGGTFPFTHYRFRDNEGVVEHAHSQWLNVLSEYGVVGLVLFAGSMALLLAAAVGNPFTWREDPSRALLVAMQTGVVVFLLHISWDWDWDMTAVGIAFFAFVGTCASFLWTRRTDSEAAGMGTDDLPDQGGDRENPPSPTRARILAWPLRLSLSLLLVLLAVSWTLPYMASRAESAALTKSAGGETAAALADARRAARYNPLAARPLVMQARLLQALGRNREALAVLQGAALLQPDNFEVHRELGLLYLEAFEARPEAKAAFAEALSLNPLDDELQMDLERATAD